MSKEAQELFPWHAQSVADVFSTLKTQAQGLSEQEAEQRLEQHGLNTLPTKKQRSGFAIFINQYTNPLMMILLIAALVSAFLREWLDVGVILFAVFLNAILGFIEEYKADRSIEALKVFLPKKTRVKRGGVESVIEARDIVPGDIVLLHAGDKITADARIVSSQAFEVSEAALTGESSPIKKTQTKVDAALGVSDRLNMVYAGTVAVAGRAEVVVVQTGIYTELGKITQLVGRVDQGKTPLQNQMARFATWLGGLIVLFSVLIFFAGLVRGFAFVEMLRVSVAIAVSAIPEGMVVALTVILAIGMQRILKKKALVRRLVATETLGSVSVICMDKTGTLTTGEMELVQLCNAQGVFGENIGDFTELAEMIWSTKQVFVREDGKGFDGTLTEKAMARHLWNQASKHKLRSCKSIAEIPFRSTYKYKAQLCQVGKVRELYVVGAPEIVLQQLDATDQQMRSYRAWLEQMISQGLRVLLFAKRSTPSLDAIDHSELKDLQFVGLVGLKDPLRKTAPETIKQAKKAGLLPIMITGDHPDTAFSIAKDAGLAYAKEQVLTGDELDTLDDVAFERLLDQVAVYARVLPRHKLRIIHAWQERGMSVAMVGDGVNDAPAVKGADIGIALGSGTEVAQEAADMILLDNHFSTIVDAIKEGRAIFDNIRKMVTYLLSNSFGEIILIIGAIIFGGPLPFLPAQILWINIATDGFPSIALTFEKAEKGIMQEPPRKRRESIINTEMKVIIFIIGIVSDIILFAIYFYLLGRGSDIAHIRTFIFIALGMNSLFYVFAVRTFRSCIFRTNPFENTWLLASVGIGFGFLFLPMVIPAFRVWFELTPLTLMEWLILAGLALAQLLMIEVVKSAFHHNQQGKGILRSR